jgi:hypothetical protein
LVQIWLGNHIVPDAAGNLHFLLNEQSDRWLVMGIEPRGFLLAPCVLWNSMGLYDDILPE